MVITDIPNSENQLDWLKGIWYGSNCQKTIPTDVAEQIKPVYNSNVQFWIPEFNVSSKKSFLANRERCPSHKQKNRNEKVQKRIPPYLTYIGDTIDQGATRLGGL